MPRYDFDCSKCGTIEVQHGMNDPHPTTCPQCSSRGLVRVFNIPRVIPPSDMWWESENGGRGHYCPQLGARPNDPAAYVKSQYDLSETCKRTQRVYNKD